MQYATKEDVGDVREDLRIHTADDKDFQRQIFDYLKRRFDGLDTRLGTLWDEMVFRKGAASGSEKTDADAEKKQNRKSKLIESAWNACISAVIAYGTIKALK